LRVDAESQRLRAEEAQRQFGDAQKRLAALSAEKSGLEERVATLERAAKERVAAKAGERERPPAGVIGKAPPRERVVPVAAKKRR
jgi:septal ring factor EnvC (AmiA/AmiB activator)